MTRLLILSALCAAAVGLLIYAAASTPRATEGEYYRIENARIIPTDRENATLLCVVDPGDWHKLTCRELIRPEPAATIDLHDGISATEATYTQWLDEQLDGGTQ